MWTVERLRAHIEGKLRAASIDTTPFPHMIVPSFFPEDIYARIQEHNLFRSNDGKHWISPAAMQTLKTPTPYDHRMQINFHENDQYTASEEANALWGLITDTFLADNWFPQLVRSVYPEYFDIRFGPAAERDDFWDRNRKELFLQRHEIDYYIGPHTDIPTRIFTCIFSFAPEKGFEEFGTQLLVHKDPYVRCWGNDHYAFDDFEVQKVAPYAPNSFLIFFKTRQSFHAVKTITADVPEQRWGMQFQYYEPAGGVFQDLSEPDIMRTRHSKQQQAPRGLMAAARVLVGRPAA